MMSGTAASEVMLESAMAINRRFTEEAIADWDLHGQGGFVLWVYYFVTQKWAELAESN